MDAGSDDHPSVNPGAELADLHAESRPGFEAVIRPFAEQQLSISTRRGN
jgi:hypothetical protein